MYKEALKFYEPLQRLPDHNDSIYFTNLASCYEAGGLYTSAIECYQAALVYDATNTDAQFQLAVLCKERGIPNTALVESNDADFAETSVWQQSKNNKKTTAIGYLSEVSPTKRSSFTMIAPRPSLRNMKQAATERTLRERAKDKDSYALLILMQNLADQVRNGDVDSTSQWMTAAKQLIDTFQAERVFFPYDKYMRFYGYTKEARKKSLNSKLELGSRGDFMTTGPQNLPSSQFNHIESFSKAN